MHDLMHKIVGHCPELTGDTNKGEFRLRCGVAVYGCVGKEVMMIFGLPFSGVALLRVEVTAAGGGIGNDVIERFVW